MDVALFCLALCCGVELLFCTDVLGTISLWSLRAPPS
jgi:hypothetical protein